MRGDAWDVAVVDMPLNSLPPTLVAPSFDAKAAAAQGSARVDFALWGGLVPGPRDRVVVHAEDPEIVEQLAAEAKCAPPLRSPTERAGLWRRLVAGEVGLVASDHSPGPPGMKRGDDMFAVWGGISGAQTTLPLLLTHGPGHGLSIGRAVELVRTGDAWVLRAEDLEYRHRHSPFAGRRLTARVVRTILRGVTVFGEGAVPEATGRLVTPARAMAR